MTETDVRVHDGKINIRLSAGGVMMSGTLSTNEARALALDVLTSQGPFLTFQPPNNSMKETNYRTPWKRRRSRPDQGAIEWVRTAMKSHRVDELQAALAYLSND